MNTTLAKVEPSHLAAVERPVSMLQFTPEQSVMIRDMYANGASESEFAFLMEIAKTRNLNPLLRQIHFVKRPDKEKKRDVWAAQVSIDGLRSIANRTGAYDGQDEPDHEYDAEGLLTVSRVKVYRKGISRPFTGVARWSEYAQTKYDGGPTHFWNKMAHTMLDKCAEALAIRKAFPEDTGGLYTPEEMAQASNEERRDSGPHSPHDDGSPPSDTLDPDVATDLLARMQETKDALPRVDSHQKALELRARIGSQSKQSDLTRDVQRAKEERLITPEQHRELSKIWQHVNRQCAKLEKELTPSVENMDMNDQEPEADPDADGR